MLATLVTTAMTARYLGPTGRGIYVAANSWVAAFSIFGFLSLSQVIVFLAAGKREEEWLPRIFGSLLAILGMIAIAGWAVAAALSAWRGGAVFKHLPPAAVVAAFVALPFMLWVENGNGILMALGELNVLNIAQVAGATAAVVLTFFAVGFFKGGVAAALLAFAAAQAVVVAISLGYITRRVEVIAFDRSAARELLTGGAKLHLNAIGSFLLTQGNVLILNNYRSPKETAYYQLAIQLVLGLQIIPLAVSTVAYSLVSRYGANGAWPHHRKLILQVVLLSCSLAVIGYFVAPFVIRVVFGVAFLPSVAPYRILLLSTAGMTFAIVMGAQWVGRGYLLQAALMTVMIGATGIVANIIVVPRWGAIGASWVTVGTYVISLVGNGIMALFVQRQWRRSLV